MDSLTLATTASSYLTPYLIKAGEKAAEEVGKKLPDLVGRMWNAITARFKGKPAAEEAVKDFVAKPDDQLNQAAFAKELRKALEAEPNFGAELARLLESAQREGGDTIIVTGSGAVGTKGGVAAGAGGVAIGGHVHGGITLGEATVPKETIPYGTIRQAQDNVLRALYQAGGELSPPELVSATQLPHDVVAWAVEGLEKKGKVRVERGATIELVLLR